MSVKLRLARHGTKKRPYYRLVAASSRMPRDGRFLEHIGSYDPLHDPPAVTLNRPRVQYWLDQGALPSPTVKKLLNAYMSSEDSAVAKRATYVPVDLPPEPEPKAAPAEEAAEAAPAEEAAEA
ncbi:MAG: 30S ribosomal protein S16, partial [Myxococcota bacterium]